MIGLLVVSFNDLGLSQRMYPSLVESMTPDTQYGLLCVDGGSSDGSVAFWQSKCEVIGEQNRDYLVKSGRQPQEFNHLSVCLNVGLSDYLEREAEYIVWIHPDHLFPQVGWLDKLVEYMKRHPEVGKGAADELVKKVDTQLINGPTEELTKVGAVGQERPGNAQLVIWPAWALAKMKEKYGYLYDERFTGIGGYEDWDFNRRIIEMGYKVVITPEARVQHIGMGTRHKTGKLIDEQNNVRQYHRKWGDTNNPV